MGFCVVFIKNVNGFMKIIYCKNKLLILFLLIAFLQNQVAEFL